MFTSCRRGRFRALLVILTALPFLFVLSCSRDTDQRSSSDGAPLQDVLTLEYSFGAEDIPDDYLLVDPHWFGLAIHPDGNLLVADENWIKVFDPDGQPVQRFGGTGAGPGEFRWARYLYMSPEGYLCVFGGRMGFTAHFFRPDFSYIERVDYFSVQPYRDILDSLDLRTDRPESVWCLGEDERLLVVGTQDRDSNNLEHREVFLFHLVGNTLTVLARYQQTDALYGQYGPVVSMDALGKLLAAPLPDGRAVYLHTFHDSRQGGEELQYTLTLIDLESGQRETLSHSYELYELTWTRPLPNEELRERDPEQFRQWEEQWDLVDEGIAERHWSVPVLGIETDGPFIFVFTSAKNDSGEVLTDVFNADERSYVGSAWFLGDYYGVRIADACLYKFNEFRVEDDFPRVDKYRIDPRVYGRR